MVYELFIEGDKKVLDVFTNQLRKFGLKEHAMNLELCWSSTLRDTLVEAIRHNSNIVLPVSYFLDEECSTYIRLEHEYVVLNSSSTYITNIRFCNKVDNGIFNEIVLYSVYCKPLQKELQ